MPKNKKSQAIHKDMTIEEIVTTYPESYDVLVDLGLHCVGCYASAFESFEEGLMKHGYEEKEIAIIVEELNNNIKPAKKDSKKKTPKKL